MKRKFRKSDGGKRFRYLGEGKFHGRIGELEGFPLMDPGSALPGEGILWFGPVDDRDGWDYVAPKDVEPVSTTRYRKLTDSELAAVRSYAAKHGRYWKDAMRWDWYRASEPGYIQALRNSHGPSWLKSFRFPEA